jgi:membrane-bound metal-dependent hydrolase YbcI (DUF457 family)
MGFQDLKSNPEKNAKMRISFQPAYHFSSVRGSALRAEIYFSPVRNLTIAWYATHYSTMLRHAAVCYGML